MIITNVSFQYITDVEVSFIVDNASENGMLKGQLLVAFSSSIVRHAEEQLQLIKRMKTTC